MNQAIKNLISIGGLLVAVISGSIWIGALSARVVTLETRMDPTRDIAELRSDVRHLDAQMHRIEKKIDKLP